MNLPSLPLTRRQALSQAGFGLGSLALAGVLNDMGLTRANALVEYRFTENIGLFVDGRWFYSPELSNGGGAIARTGLRFAF